MTAPDPGLTDLIAAHICVEPLRCGCGFYVQSTEEWAKHLALVVERHTNRRIAEPEATSEGGKRWYVNGYASVEFDAACDIWLNEVDPYVGDSGHARKLAAALHAAATAADDHRAALEGES
ncbi:hypothetical protein EU244_025095 [Rhodococcus qingshengii]|uniref:hypothetical protein n=1 Tax=Rhodococcus qingshengii TaxID=334542 RepID=UPI0010A63F49|nr:hypothetical protein [Rhodococcus qingshengii]THJ70714.1 hypothetical protein EU244_15355 [Rhodococcus qingshengii]